MRQIIITLFFILFLTPVFAQSKVIKLLKDSNLVQLSLVFYPSTLRMLNIQKDTAYNKMIRGIEKLKFYTMRSDKFNLDLFYETNNKLINQENYEEYMVWDGPDYQMQILGKPKTNEMVGLASLENEFYIFDLKGTIDFMQIPDLYEKLSSQDSTMSNNGFSFLIDMVQQDKSDRESREKRRERREREKLEEEAEKIKADSLKVNSNSKPNTNSKPSSKN